jgi:hypothetical protein
MVDKNLGSGAFQIEGRAIEPGSYRLPVGYGGDSDHGPASAETAIAVE